MKSRESRNNGRYNMQLHTMCIYVHQVHQWEFLTFSLPDLIYLYYFSLSAIEFVWCQFWEIFGIGWTNNPRLIDVFLYSFHLSPWYCIDDYCREKLCFGHSWILQARLIVLDFFHVSVLNDKEFFLVASLCTLQEIVYGGNFQYWRKSQWLFFSRGF